MVLSKLSISSPVSKIPGIGFKIAARLNLQQINTVGDLLYYFPFRYEDLTNKKKIAEVQIGETVSVQANIWQVAKFKTHKGRTIIKATVNDGSASLEAVWFNQEYLLSKLKQNQILNLSGKIGFFGRKIALINPTFELVSENQKLIHTQGLVPVYLQKGGLSKKFLRNKIYQLLHKSNLSLIDPLPTQVIKKESLLGLQEALEKIHFPSSLVDAIKARKRFAFEELLFLHLNNLTTAKKTTATAAPKLILNSVIIDKYRGSLPFKLTDSQERAVSEILTDLSNEKPMNRLLQGEVGSGKTVVSSFAIKACLESGFQAAFMAPTEILAKQHFETLRQFLGKEYSIGLSTSSARENVSSAQLLVGTHALLEKKVNLAKLGLVIVDEQQRFGVVQRLSLREKAASPHFLTMSATPIPRTLALTYFGNLELSRLSELPSNRKKVKTYLVPKFKRRDSYEFLRKKIAEGEQVYLVCPFIEPSETLESVKSATTEFDFLQKKVFPKEKLGLLHGRLHSKEKNQVLDDFRSGKVNLLVSTPVVEVGIDIPNATIIVIEAAERYGLSSLHQLRGRVGRGDKQSYCFIFTEHEDSKSFSRLKVLQNSSNGFEIAEKDLKLRGAGDIYGSLQHGHFKLKMTEAVNLDLIQETRAIAQKLIAKGLTSEMKLLIEESNFYLENTDLD